MRSSLWTLFRVVQIGVVSTVWAALGFLVGTVTGAGLVLRRLLVMSYVVCFVQFLELVEKVRRTG